MGKICYTVYVDDNFHFMDEDERVQDGQFSDCESAKKRCMEIVDAWLINAFQPGMTSDVLLSSYKAFGKDPWISAQDADCTFSAWAYAEQRCEEMCKNQKDDWIGDDK